MGKKHKSKSDSTNSAANLASNTKIPTVFAAFSPTDGIYYGIVTPGIDRYRLRIFDTATGIVKNEFEEEDSDGKWTCLRWGVAVEGATIDGVRSTKQECVFAYPEN